MHLPGCPYIIADIPEDKVGWICLRPVDFTVPPPQSPPTDEDGKGKAEVGDQYSQAAASHAASSYDGEMQRRICLQYNGPREGKCVSASCKGVRVKEHSTPACPQCRTELPRNYRNLHRRTLTVSGPRNAGKTHYIVALNAWWNDHLSDFDLIVTPFMSDPVQNYFDNHWNIVRQGDEPLPATVRGRVFSFSWLISHALDDSAPGILCTLPDVSGESLGDRDELISSGHYDAAAGIILLLDGERIAKSARLYESKHDVEDHRKVVTAMLRDLARQERPEGFRTVPVAVCVNKVDLLAELDPDWAAIVQDYTPHHQGRFDETVCKARSQAIKSLLLSQPGTAGVTRQIDKAFDFVMFFAIATIGTKEKPYTFKPLCVEDPFLWLLYHMGMVDCY